MRKETEEFHGFGWLCQSFFPLFGEKSLKSLFGRVSLKQDVLWGNCNYSWHSETFWEGKQESKQKKEERKKSEGAQSEGQESIITCIALAGPLSGLNAVVKMPQV